VTVNSPRSRVTTIAIVRDMHTSIAVGPMVRVIKTSRGHVPIVRTSMYANRVRAIVVAHTTVKVCAIATSMPSETPANSMRLCHEGRVAVRVHWVMHRIINQGVVYRVNNRVRVYIAIWCIPAVVKDVTMAMCCSRMRV